MYGLIYYWNPDDFDKFPRSGEKLGRYLGVSKDKVQTVRFGVVPQQSKSPQENFVYIPRKTVRGVLPKEPSNPEFKYKFTNLDATIIAKCGDPVTQANTEEFIVDNIPIWDEAVSTTKPKDMEHVILEQDYAPIPAYSD